METISKKILLAIETALEPGSLSLWEGERETRSRILSGGVSSSVELLSAIDELLKAAGVKPYDLAKLVISNGNGSVTGLRVGAATACGLKNALSTEMETVDIFDALDTYYRTYHRTGPVLQIYALRALKNKVIWMKVSYDSPAAKCSTIKTGVKDEFIREITALTRGGEPENRERRILTDDSLYDETIRASSQAGNIWVEKLNDNKAFYLANFKTAQTETSKNSAR